MTRADVKVERIPSRVLLSIQLPNYDLMQQQMLMQQNQNRNVTSLSFNLEEAKALVAQLTSAIAEMEK
jgi:hypothetical protein